MKNLKILCVVILIGMLSVGLSYADPNGKGNGANNGQGRGRSEQGNENNQGNQNNNEHANNQANNANQNSQANNANQSNNANQNSSAPQSKSENIDRAKNQADIRANRPTEIENRNSDKKSNTTARTEQGRSADHVGKKGNNGHVNDLLDALNKARWSYNPLDERGQGNMGKPNMRDPYGFDKDSGREKSERGRPIQEETPEFSLNLAEIVSIDFTITDQYLAYLQSLLLTYQNLAQRYPNSWYSYYATFLENYIKTYTSTYNYDRIRVNMNDTIDYSLTLSSPEGFEGTTLIVTTSLISVNDYDGYTWYYDYATRSWVYKPIHYDAGQVVVEESQEVVLGTDNTINYTYDPPSDLAGYSGFYGTLEVTVTEPESGTTYTTTYDRQLYLYRCPYGKVYDKLTGQSIVGAKVTVHYEDDSLVALDKASNPTANNPQTTDATGRYGFKLETGRKYYLQATAPGYKEYKSPIFTEKWHVLREDIALTPELMFK